ncbi:MAG: LamG-like jellyroll fold domain-containing protein, partial [Bacteroidales bacterium]
DLFTNTDNAIGTGATTYTANTISANTWYRMVITVRNGSFFRIYINGENWLDAAGQQVDGRFALASELLLFADNDGEDGLIDCSEVSIWDVALTAEQVAKLGDATTQVTALQDHLLMPGAELGQNYPNPFTNTTIIPYQVTQTADVCFRLLDDKGNEVRLIKEGTKSPGKYTLTMSSDHLKSGNYVLQMTANKKVITRKLILVK